MTRIGIFLCAGGAFIVCCLILFRRNQDLRKGTEAHTLHLTEQPLGASTAVAIKESLSSRPASGGGDIGKAVTALAEAAAVEISRGHAYPLPEGEAIDSRQYMAPFQTLCFVSTVDGARLVIVSKDEYPGVWDAFEAAKDCRALEGCRSSPEDTAVILTMRHAPGASLLVAPFPCGLPGLGYSLELALGSSDPVYARDSTDEMVHSDQKGLGPVRSAWSFRTFAFSPNEQWKLDLGQGAAPPSFSIRVRPN